MQLKLFHNCYAKECLNMVGSLFEASQVYKLGCSALLSEVAALFSLSEKSAFGDLLYFASWTGDTVKARSQKG
jgi:hypothetical protein